MAIETADFFGAAYIGFPESLRDSIGKLTSYAVVSACSKYWTIIMIAFILIGLSMIFSGLSDKVRQLGGGMNKWSKEARVIKWKIIVGILLMHANVCIMGVMGLLLKMSSL